MQRRKSRRIEDSDEEIPRSGPDSPVAKKERLEDSDDDMPLFGPNGLAEKVRQEACRDNDQEACRDNDVTLRVTPDRLLGIAPLAPARR